MARKKNLVWEVPQGCWSPGLLTNTQILSIIAAGNTLGDQQQETAQLVTPADVETTEKDFIWVERIVGQIFICGVNENLSQGLFYLSCVKERIHVGRQFHDAAGVPLVIFEDIYAEEGAQESFLWERTALRPVTGTTDFVSGNVVPTFSNGLYPGMSDGAHPWSTGIDVRVGRALSTDMALGYTVSVIDVAGVAYDVWGWLRLLVSRGG